jgi:hypothetical protein
MPLYTVIFEYRAGTYISQTQAEDESSAVRVWAENLDIREIQHFGLSGKQAVISEVENSLLGICRAIPKVRRSVDRGGARCLWCCCRLGSCWGWPCLRRRTSPRSPSEMS